MVTEDRFSPVAKEAAGTGARTRATEHQPARIHPPVKSVRPRVNPPKSPNGVSVGWNRFWIVVGVSAALLITLVALLQNGWSVSGLFEWLLLTGLCLLLALYNAGQVSRKKTAEGTVKQDWKKTNPAAQPQSFPYPTAPGESPALRPLPITADKPASEVRGQHELSSGTTCGQVLPAQGNGKENSRENGERFAPPVRDQD